MFNLAILLSIVFGIPYMYVKVEKTHKYVNITMDPDQLAVLNQKINNDEVRKFLKDDLQAIYYNADSKLSTFKFKISS